MALNPKLPASICLTLSLLSFSCQPSEMNTTPLPSEEPSTSTPASPEPTPATPSESAPEPTPATPSESAPEPTPTPTPEATPEPTPIPSPTVETTQPEPTPTPTALPNTLRIVVFDEDNNQVKDATVRVQSTDALNPFDGTAERESANIYTLSDVPTDVLLSVRASSSNTSPLTQNVAVGSFETEVTLEFKDNTALSKYPFVSSVSPLDVVDADEPIELVFSENMDRDSVEASFAIQAVQATEFLTGTPVPKALSFFGNAQDSVYDSRNVNFDWQGDKRVIITPNHGWPITQDNSFRLILNYRRNSESDGRGIKNSSGIEAREPTVSTNNNGTTEDGPFRINTERQASIAFSVNNNLEPIEIKSVRINSNAATDSFSVTFDQDLYFTSTNNAQVIGGADGSSNRAPAGHSEVSPQEAAQNYTVKCEGENRPIPDGSVAVFESDVQVEVRVPEGENLFDSGESCDIGVKSSIISPAGLSIPAETIGVIIP